MSRRDPVMLTARPARRTLADVADRVVVAALGGVLLLPPHWLARLLGVIARGAHLLPGGAGIERTAADLRSIAAEEGEALEVIRVIARQSRPGELAAILRGARRLGRGQG